jgi:DNA modification methylase
LNIKNLYYAFKENTMNSNCPNQIYQVDVTELRTNPLNARQHSTEQVNLIAQSIQVLGFRSPILVDEDNVIMAGHGRLLAAQELKMKTVPVVRFSDMTKAQKNAYLIADNRIAEQSTWDTDLVVDAFEEIKDLDPDFDLSTTGFAVHEIDNMVMSKYTSDETEELPEKIPEPEEIVCSRLGDSWIMDHHIIRCGNSLEPENYEELMGKEKAQICATDPPYNVPIRGHVSGLGDVVHEDFAMASGEMSRAEYIELLRTNLALIHKYGMPGMLAYVYIDWRHVRDMIEVGEDIFGDLKQLCTWVKDKAGMGAFYRSQHELICIFKKGGAKHINNFQLGQFGRHRSNVWNYPGMNSGSETSRHLLKLHPTVKPVAMLVDILLDASKPNGIVLDPFGGSGSTLIAAEKTGRRARLIEIDPKYVDVTVKRWQDLTGKAAIHATSGETFSERMNTALTQTGAMI